MTEENLDRPEHFFNRELSWLEFNDRVLREGMSESVPLLERLKFLSIVSSNLDEFFMIRVAGLKQQLAARVRKRDPSGLTPAAQLAAISERTHRMVAEQDASIADVLARLREEGLRLLGVEEVSPEQREFVDNWFSTEVLPTLTPLAVGQLDPCPLLPGKRLYLALRLSREDGEEGEGPNVAFVPIPDVLPRFVTLPSGGGLEMVRLEDVVRLHVGRVFPGHAVEAVTLFRITRDADVAVSEEDAADLLSAMEDAVRARGRRAVVRLTLAARPDAALRRWLMDWADVRKQDVYEVDGLLDAADLMALATRPGFDHLKYPDWRPLPPRELIGCEDLWQTITERDILLSHPYESFEPVTRLLEQAAEDPNVLAIKQTLYRTSGDSPVVAALLRAAENGKQVTVLVELKARFDEARNVDWARRLEDAGCFVIYGIAGFKTHAKALLIVRREAHRVRRYLHLSTGNYNDKTAKLYSDLGLLTSDQDMTADAAAFFNLLTGYSQTVGWSKFAIAPTHLRRRVLEMIDREIQASTPDRPGLILAKTNSLEDREICLALYRASRAGVRVKLNVRGICCLRPGLEGVSENIEVVSIVGRYLEHARIFYFRNGGHEEAYLSSADWMVRNLDKRLELLFPVQQPDLLARLKEMLEVYFADNVKSHRLLADGTYERVRQTGQAVESQRCFHEQAVEAVAAAEAAAEHMLEFRPITRPRERS